MFFDWFGPAGWKSHNLRWQRISLLICFLLHCASSCLSSSHLIEKKSIRDYCDRSQKQKNKNKNKKKTLISRRWEQSLRCCFLFHRQWNTLIGYENDEEISLIKIEDKVEQLFVLYFVAIFASSWTIQLLSWDSFAVSEDWRDTLNMGSIVILIATVRWNK